MPDPSRKRKTSDTHPILVDWVETGLPGKLGMTFAPGKKDLNSWTAAWDRDLDKDLAHLAGHHGVDVLVPLIEGEEMRLLKIDDLLLRIPQHGMDVTYFPFTDVSTPRSMLALHELVEELVDELKRGRNVVVHCRGGLGRTGLVVACVLVWLGLSAAEAVAETRQARSGTIQTDQQEDYVYAYEAYLEDLESDPWTLLADTD